MELNKRLEIAKTLFFYYCEISCLFIIVYFEKFYRLFVPRPLKSLASEIILITGTGNGIGKQLALQIAKLEPTSQIICWDVEKEANEATVNEIKKKNVKAYGFTVDVSDRVQVAAAAEKIRANIGNVSILINNAGIAPSGPYLIQKPETIERIFKINTLSNYWTINEFLPTMIKRNHGHIITMASISCYLPMRDLAGYSSSKYAINGFIEALKQEVRFHPSKPFNIHFTTVYPIIVRTRLLEAVVLYPRFEGMIPTITPEYVAKKTIEGFRQNYEYIYLPPAAQLLASLRMIFPSEIIRKFEEDILTCDVKHLNLNEEDLAKYEQAQWTSNNNNNALVKAKN